MKQYLPIKQSSMLISLGIMNGEPRAEYSPWLQFVLALHPLMIAIPAVGFGFLLGLVYQFMSL